MKYQLTLILKWAAWCFFGYGAISAFALGVDSGNLMVFISELLGASFYGLLLLAASEILRAVGDIKDKIAPDPEEEEQTEENNETEE